VAVRRLAHTRPYAPMAVTALLGASLAVWLRGPLVGLPVDAPLLGAAFESSAAVVALLLAYLAFGRSRTTGLLRDLALVYALTLLALTNLFLSAVPAMIGIPADRAPVPAAVVAVAAALFAYASSGVERDATPASRAGLDLAAVLLASIAVLAAVVLLGGGAEHSPQAVSSLEVAAACGFAVGAFGFARRTVDDDAPLLRWLAIGATLAAIARIDYAVFPAAAVAWISPGDALRLGFYLALGVGAAKEIRLYWQDAVRVAALDERRRISRDLHDGLAQELSYIVLEAEALGHDADDERLRALAASAQRALGESRRVIATFSVNGDEPLDAAIAQTAEDVAHRFGVPLAFSLDDGVELEGRAREDLLRIVREAVTNAARHARPDRIEVELTNHDGIAVRIRDDGRGFDPRDDEVVGGGFGLRSMRERAEAMGGELNVWSVWGAGTEITVRLP
jgi:signal transduction histidine kinase